MLLARAKSPNGHDFQPFSFRQLRLPHVRRQEMFAFKRERTGHMKQVNGPGSESFRVGRGEVHGTSDNGVHVQRHVEQGATGEEMFEPGQCGIAFARDGLAFAGSD